MALFTQNTEGFRVFNKRKIRYQWCCFLFIYFFVWKHQRSAYWQVYIKNLKTWCYKFRQYNTVSLYRVKQNHQEKNQFQFHNYFFNTACEMRRQSINKRIFSWMGSAVHSQIPTPNICSKQQTFLANQRSGNPPVVMATGEWWWRDRI